MAKLKSIRFNDITLRDEEQAAGVNFFPEEKPLITRQLVKVTTCYYSSFHRLLYFATLFINEYLNYNKRLVYTNALDGYTMLVHN